MDDYRPINCDFHDLLESLSMHRKPTHVRFLDDEGGIVHRSAVIVDVFSRGGAEFLSLSTGDVVRLDRLLAVDKAHRPGS